MIDRKETANLYRASFVLALTLIISGLFFWLIRDFVTVVLLSAIFGVLLHPFYCWLQRAMNTGPGTTSGLVIITFLIAIGIPLLALASLVGAEALGVSKSVAPWLKENLYGGGKLSLDWPTWLPFESELEIYQTQIVEKLGELAGNVGQFLFDSISSATRGTFGFFLSAFIFCYALFFFLKRGPELVDTVLKYLPLHETERTLLIDRGLKVTMAILKSILIIGILQGILVGLAFWVLGIKGAIFWGTVVMIISAIPVVGSGVIWLPAAIFLLADGQPAAAIGLVVWGALIVGLVDNILRPRLVSGDANMPDLIILLAILGGIGAFGLAGIIIGPVLAAIFLTVLEIYKVVFAEWLTEKQEDGISDA
jgi:predicted PurR-regulated permease PerM